METKSFQLSKSLCYKPVLNGRFRSIDRKIEVYIHYRKTIQRKSNLSISLLLQETEVKGVICSIEIPFSFRETIKPKQRFEVCATPIISVSLERGHFSVTHV